MTKRKQFPGSKCLYCPSDFTYAQSYVKHVYAQHPGRPLFPPPVEKPATTSTPRPIPPQLPDNAKKQPDVKQHPGRSPILQPQLNTLATSRLPVRPKTNPQEMAEPPVKLKRCGIAIIEHPRHEAMIACIIGTKEGVIPTGIEDTVQGLEIGTSGDEEIGVVPGTEKEVRIESENESGKGIEIEEMVATGVKGMVQDEEIEAFHETGLMDEEDAPARSIEASSSAAANGNPKKGEDVMDVVAEGETDVVDDPLQAMMGFGGFGTTKQKKVPGNDVYAESYWRL
ncbi:MAG: hypothetical protein M1816_000462 [Peltula sp. TS41687]|nr:MAG: hypothetical protein M1816_000462 [Peltula sp. TS41687]